MKKEKLTLEAIKQDLMKVAWSQMSNKADWRFAYIVPITIAAVLLGVLLKSILVGVLIFGVAAYQIVRYVIEYREHKQDERAIISLVERGELSISNEVLDRIATETIYEPHSMGKRINHTKTIAVYYFNGGDSWRVPEVYRHYDWSKDFYLSSKGLENISIVGDEFYFVSLQAHHDIAYIYPCKIFELDADLKNNVR